MNSVDIGMERKRNLIGHAGDPRVKKSHIPGNCRLRAFLFVAHFMAHVQKNHLLQLWCAFAGAACQKSCSATGSQSILKKHRKNKVTLGEDFIFIGSEHCFCFPVPPKMQQNFTVFIAVVLKLINLFSQYFFRL